MPNFILFFLFNESICLVKKFLFFNFKDDVSFFWTEIHSKRGICLLHVVMALLVGSSRSPNLPFLFLNHFPIFFFIDSKSTKNTSKNHRRNTS